ncbi:MULTISPECIES: MDR efflux pump AcrAB transcriptional activator RobA [Pantoea]|jgi:AraC family transcriptional activator of mar-sox-rob regulon|uniref:MDR efflux pump AcrAB transcriptional activator RobA n=1 Tax=Pantoea piersonii TaxID=2364647 RepID=A0AAJ5QIC9_9GAMM|nr:MULTISPECIES: MDR efflux pump AcrAB transcriptional activator RobA [Pantoea]HCW97227.1 MDR efflux pump AcrAB transcriptional activator RobA [Pantoea sp.]MBZ6387895.1 MDR efflux pump AcrAB transcriptional activator RobA [Pantoea piersonii]MBZ6400978.1 MDR efflux pump AcrAB transcriptional activator RobA [Pantoea piersonii]MBZ6409446.1 MDR efflux pump AcrAB transcriptional activator RobA [Pantoea piersonii]MBZ6426023.1 MDR efflux pump AcrAB transcriptional activator RobA [Pantoea piersonii]
MDQAGIIRDLLVWLESHLDQPLSLDNVALKAGYSKWHLQRMFKDVTGHAIGAYIRARRLSKAAVALRLTSRPILDIALQYRFDSQQTFTRAFKKQFNQTPAWYRRSSEWNSFGIRPPIRLDDNSMPESTFVTLPETVLVGQTQSYNCTLEQISRYRDEMRIHFWKQFLLETDTIPPVLYGLHQVRASQEKDDEQEILYTTAVPSDQAVNLHSGQSVLLEAGDYVQFTYNGPRNELQDFILLLYGTCMPTLGLTRRQGQDIERFITHGGKKRSEPPKEIRCEYLIPIRHQQAN